MENINDGLEEVLSEDETNCGQSVENYKDSSMVLNSDHGDNSGGSEQLERAQCLH